MIVAITGPRLGYPTLAELEAYAEAIGCTRVDRWLWSGGPEEVRQGGARGIDQAVAKWTKARIDTRVTLYSADWDRYHRAAGMIRNRDMLDGKREGELPRRADMLVRFGIGGPGTRGCSREAEKRDIPVTMIEPTREPRIWNMHHGKPPCEPGMLIYVGRSAKWGGRHVLANPARVKLRPGETRAEAAPRILDEYRAHLWHRIRLGQGMAYEAMRALTADHWIGCTCWPAHCHCEVIVKAWRWMHGGGT